MKLKSFSDWVARVWSYFLHYVWSPLRQLVLPVKVSYELNSAKPTSAIPGPNGWPILGDIRNLNKAGGSAKMIQYVEKLHKEYGGIVKVQLGPNKYIFVSDPIFYKEIIQQESSCPLSYKQPQVLLFNSTFKKNRGLFFQDGEDWVRSRRILTKLILKDTGFMGIIFEKLYEPIVLQFIQKWELESKSNELRPKIIQECYEVFLKGILAITFGKHYENFLSKAGGDVKTLIDHSIEISSLQQDLNDVPPSIAKAVGLKVWKRYEELTLTVINMGHGCTNHALEKMEKSENSSLEEFGLIHRFRNISEANDEDIRVHCTDFCFEIPDPASVSTLWLIYTLGRNPQVQEKIREEIAKVYSPNHIVSYKDLKKMPYLRAVQKEILRMYPTAPFVARVLDHDMVIGGYNVPSGFHLILSTNESHNDPNYFRYPDKCLPERWMEESELSFLNLKSIPGARNEEAYRPWGISKRTCVGQIIVSAMLRLFMAMLVQKFNVESEEVQKKMKNLLYPDREMKIKLVSR